MLQNPILHYLDNAATMVAPRWRMSSTRPCGNTGQTRQPVRLGARSEEALNAARAAVARTLGCKPKELHYLLRRREQQSGPAGAVLHPHFRQGHRGVRLLSTPASSARWKSWRSRATTSRVVRSRPDGTLISTKCWSTWDKNTILVACMVVNNEVGTRNDVERLAAEVKRRNSRTIVHVDAVQAWMRVPIKRRTSTPCR